KIQIGFDSADIALWNEIRGSSMDSGSSAPGATKFAKLLETFRLALESTLDSAISGKTIVLGGPDLVSGFFNSNSEITVSFPVSAGSESVSDNQIVTKVLETLTNCDNGSTFLKTTVKNQWQTNIAAVSDIAGLTLTSVSLAADPVLAASMAG
ncbi:unnamed protein product, partial [Amoebophrya sp. A120]